LKNFSFEIPNTWNLKPGDMPFVRATQNAQGWNVHLTGKPSVNVSDASLANPTGLVTAQKFNAQLELMGLPSSLQAQQNLGSKLGMLLQQQVDFNQSAMLMRPDQLALMANNPALVQWLSAFKKMSLNMSHVSAQSLKKMVLSQAVSAEHLLANAEEVEDSPRSLLHRLLESLESSSSEEKRMDQSNQACPSRDGVSPSTMRSRLDPRSLVFESGDSLFGCRSCGFALQKAAPSIWRGRHALEC
jgi:hypothetical protein